MCLFAHFCCSGSWIFSSMMLSLLTGTKVPHSCGNRVPSDSSAACAWRSASHRPLLNRAPQQIKRAHQPKIACQQQAVQSQEAPQAADALLDSLKWDQNGLITAIVQVIVHCILCVCTWHKQSADRSYDRCSWHACGIMVFITQRHKLIIAKSYH